MTSENNEESRTVVPEGSTVLVCPRGADERGRSTWAWLPGSVVSQRRDSRGPCRLLTRTALPYRRWAGTAPP